MSPILGLKHFCLFVLEAGGVENECVHVSHHVRFI